MTVGKKESLICPLVACNNQQQQQTETVIFSYRWCLSIHVRPFLLFFVIMCRQIHTSWNSTILVWQHYHHYLYTLSIPLYLFVSTPFHPLALLQSVFPCLHPGLSLCPDVVFVSCVFVTVAVLHCYCYCCTQLMLTKNDGLVTIPSSCTSFPHCLSILLHFQQSCSNQRSPTTSCLQRFRTSTNPSFHTHLTWHLCHSLCHALPSPSSILISESPPICNPTLFLFFLLLRAVATPRVPSQRLRRVGTIHDPFWYRSTSHSSPVSHRTRHCRLAVIITIICKSRSTPSVHLYSLGE